MSEVSKITEETTNETTKEVADMKKRTITYITGEGELITVEIKAEITTEAKDRLREILDEREFDFFMFRNGFIDGEFHTLEECAQHYGTTCARARQTDTDIMRKIHRHCPDFWKDYYGGVMT